METLAAIFSLLIALVALGVALNAHDRINLHKSLFHPNEEIEPRDSPEGTYRIKKGD